MPEIIVGYGCKSVLEMFITKSFDQGRTIRAGGHIEHLRKPTGILFDARPSPALLVFS